MHARLQHHAALQPLHHQSHLSGGSHHRSRLAAFSACPRSAQLPFDVVASPVLDIRTGFPFSRIDENQNFVGPRNKDNRFTRFISLDAQITKGVSLPILGKKYKTRIGVKIFNITNHFNPRDVQSNIDSVSFGAFSNSVGRTFRGKFEFEF